MSSLNGDTEAYAHRDGLFSDSATLCRAIAVEPYQTDTSLSPLENSTQQSRGKGELQRLC